MISVVQDWRALWPWVESGLWEIIERTNPTWLPPDVYGELRANNGTVLATINEDAGFCIFKRTTDWDGPVLFIWCLWWPGGAEQTEAFVEELQGMARSAKCVKLQMRSPRGGWTRKGWRERETIYEKELP